VRPLTQTDHCSFDDFTDEYDRVLQKGLSLSGENRLFFARQRVTWLRHCLRLQGLVPQALMDFGCGTGSTSALVLELLPLTYYVGVDVSDKALDFARRSFGTPRTTFTPYSVHPPCRVDVAYCNGVFHHINPANRPAAVTYVRDALRPGGVFAFWENNPWSLGARLVMSRVSFDRDAILISAPKARAMLREVGFEILRTDFLFIFPRSMRLFSWVEPHVARFPLGAQYQILARKER
jgi:SAM-dependent methyltransferase